MTFQSENVRRAVVYNKVDYTPVGVWGFGGA